MDKTLVNLLVIKLVKFHCNFIVSFNDTISDRHASYRNGYRSTARIHQKRSVAFRFAWTVDHHVWGVMLEAYHKLHPQPKSVTELKKALQVNWNSLSQEPINKVVKSFTRWLKRCTKADGEQFKHMKWLPIISDIIARYRYLKRKHRVVSVTLFYCVFVQTFLARENRLVVTLK